MSNDSLTEFLRLVGTLPIYLHVRVGYDDARDDGTPIVDVAVFEDAPSGGWTSRLHAFRRPDRSEESIHSPYGACPDHLRFAPMLRGSGCAGEAGALSPKVVPYLQRFIEKDLPWIVENRDKPPMKPRLYYCGYCGGEVPDNRAAEVKRKGCGVMTRTEDL
jgi:hypothetical protein